MVGSTLKLIRIRRGLSQVALSEKTGLSNSYLSLIEADKRSPDIKVLSTICQALGVDMPVLLFMAEHHELAEDYEDELYAVMAKRALRLLE